MKILISGAAGYQGTKIIPILLKLNHRIIAIDTMWFGNRLKKHKNLKIIKKNIIDVESNDLKKVDIVLHLASIANDPMGDLKQHLTWEYSCIATMKLAELCIKNKVKKLIYASSASVYGVKREKKVTEQLSLEPISTYNKAKMIAERVLLSYKKHMNISIIRPATVCGVSPRMRFDVSVNMLTYQAIKNKKITVFGGSQIRPNIHIDDLLRLYIKFFSNDKKYNGIFNAGFENLSINKIAKLVQLQVPCKIVKIKNSKDIRSYRVNSDKLLKLGFRPKKTVEQAIKEVKKEFKDKINNLDKRFFSIDWLKKKFSDEK